VPHFPLPFSGLGRNLPLRFLENSAGTGAQVRIPQAFARKVDPNAQR
jgi:hypothetical protein